MGGGYSKFSTNIQRKNYYTDRYPILVDQRGKLVDGSHRFACALAKHVDRVPIRFLNKKVEVTSYGRDWFENQEFHDEFLRELDDRLRDILISSGAAYELIIWPPALQFTEEIEAFIAARYPIIAHAKKRPIANFTRFLEDVYLSDDIDHWKIQKKIYHMRDYEPIITVLTFLIDAPAYRAKSRTSSYLSGAAAKLKAEIRGRYRDRITNYIHDIVVHIGDNPSMNRDIVNTLHNHGVMLDKHIRQY